MDVQMMDPLRRTTRSALAEIPVRLGMLRVTPLTPPATPTNEGAVVAPRTGTRNGLLTPTTINVSGSYLSPAMSPDELVIQQRGRRRIPVTWSPDNFKKGTLSPLINGNRTPQKSPSKLQQSTNNNNNNNNNTVTLRTTPRKRLLLSEQLELTPEKTTKQLQLSPIKRSPSKPYHHNTSPLIKRAKLDLTSTLKPQSDSIDTSLKGLSKEQLIDVIKSLVDKHPDIEKDLKLNLPAPDIKRMEEKLNHMKRNISKSIPSCRLTSRTDSQAFSRAALHLNSFKKCLVDQTKALAEGQHWHVLLDYSILAWSYVRATPLWDNHAHNAVRRLCFKNLVAHCLQSLRHTDHTKTRCEELYERFRCMSMDCEDALNCVKLIENKMHIC